MYLVVLFFPLLSTIICGFFGRFLGRTGVSIISLFCLFSSVLLSIFLFYEVTLCNSICSFKLFNWVSSGLLYLSWGVLFDSLTSIMLIVVLFISFLVHLYSISYMWDDPHFIRFMSYLSLFTVFMLVLVTSDNFLQMFLGWEGVGLASYLLINFWFTRINANKAAIKAIILNRIGDFGIIFSILLIFFVFQSVDYSLIFSINFFFYNFNIEFLSIPFNCLSFICFFIFLGAVGKSAQLGLHTWLPDAMEGPTPVSALIHAATMVTAGVFIILRCSPLFEFTESLLVFIMFLGGATAFFAATVGAFQNDLKKVIAYSTCSQLGYMIFSCGLSSYPISLFHLFNHAFFKALLFLSAGAVIHGMVDEQDMRKMGSLINFMPFSYVLFLIGSLSLMGFPFLTGFYSKDAILEIAFTGYSINSFFVFWLGVISALFTSFYSVRLLSLTFLVKYNGFKSMLCQIHDAPFIMLFPLVFLSLCSIFFGFFFRELFIGLGVNIWNNSLFVFPANDLLLFSEFIPYYLKLIPTLFSLFGASLALTLNFFFKIFPLDFNYLKNRYIGFFKFVYTIINKKWFFDVLYNKLISFYILFFGYHVSLKLIDRGIIELIGPFGIVNLVNKFSITILKIQTKYIYHYTFNIFVGFILLLYCIILFIFFFRFNFFFENFIVLFMFIILLISNLKVKL